MDEGPIGPLFPTRSLSPYNYSSEAQLLRYEHTNSLYGDLHISIYIVDQMSLNQQNHGIHTNFGNRYKIFQELKFVGPDLCGEKMNLRKKLLP